MALPDMGDGGALAAIGTAMTVLAAGVYKAMRGIKADGRQDTTVADLEARLKVERERADRFAQERMEKSEENATLRADLRNLSLRFDELERSVAEKNTRIAALEREVGDLETVYDILVEEAATTNALLLQSGHGDIIEKVQALHAQREHALGLLARRKAPCAPADQLHDQSQSTRKQRLSGNPAPLKEQKK